VSDDMALTWTAIQTVLYILQLCNYSTIAESTIYPEVKILHSCSVRLRATAGDAVFPAVQIM